MPCVVLLARQRSGTGVLSLALGAHPEVIRCDEILHPEGLRRPYNFYGWCARRQPPFLTVADLCTYFRRYLNALGKRDRWFLLDIKITNLRDFSQPFTMGSYWILQEIMRREIPIIWLRRKNLVDVWVSGQLAKLNGVYHVYTGQETKIDVRQTYVSRKDIEGFIRYAQKEDLELEETFLAYSRLLRLEYDELFDSQGLISSELLHTIADFIGVSEDKFSCIPALIKQSDATLKDKITNFDEIADLIAKQELMWASESNPQDLVV